MLNSIGCGAKRIDMTVTLDKLPVKKSGIITKVGGEGALRLRFLDMGLIPGTQVTVYKIAPLGDPIEIHLRGYSLTIRKEDAANIELSRLDDDGEIREFVSRGGEDE